MQRGDIPHTEDGRTPAEVAVAGVVARLVDRSSTRRIRRSFFSS